MFCVTGAAILSHFKSLGACFLGGAALWTCPIVSCSMVFANRIGRAASSCDNVQIPWPAWDIVRVPLCVAGAVFIGEDPSCVECFFCMIGSAAFRIGTAARGAMLPSSFVPCRMAGAILGDVVTCHSRLDPPHSTAHTFHYHSDICDIPLHILLSAPESTLDTLH